LTYRTLKRQFTLDDEALEDLKEELIYGQLRSQPTVMFCDLADSTQLSGQLDPEDLRDVIRARGTSVGLTQWLD
jgi:class 3 adenylate cyclase